MARLYRKELGSDVADRITIVPQHRFFPAAAADVTPKAGDRNRDAGVLSQPVADGSKALPIAECRPDFRPEAQIWPALVSGFFARRCARRFRVSGIQLSANSAPQACWVDEASRRCELGKRRAALAAPGEMSDIGKKGGAKGGHARAKKLTKEKRAAIARKAAEAKWKKARLRQ